MRENMKPIGKLMFAPGQHPHFMDIHVVDTVEELKKLSINDECESDTEGFCYYDFDSKGPYMGRLVFQKNHLTPVLLVHECTHAALFFMSHMVMPSSVVSGMNEEEQGSYWNEGVPRLADSLFEQGYKMLFGDMPSLKINHTSKEEVGG